MPQVSTLLIDAGVLPTLHITKMSCSIIFLHKLCTIQDLAIMHDTIHLTYFFLLSVASFTRPALQKKIKKLLTN